MKLLNLISLVALATNANAGTPKSDWTCDAGDASPSVLVYFMGNGPSRLNPQSSADKVKLVVWSDSASDYPSNVHYFGEITTNKSEVIEILAQKNKYVQTDGVSSVISNSVYLKIDGKNSIFAYGGNVQRFNCSK